MRSAISAAFEKLDGEVLRGNAESIRLETGTAGTLILTFRLIEGGMRPGDVLEIERYAFQIANRFQTEHPERRDYVTLEAPKHVEISLQPPSWGLNKLKMELLEGALAPCDELILRIGDRSGGYVGCEMFWTATRGRIRLRMGSGERTFQVSDDYYFDIVHRSEPKCLRLLGPTVVAPNERFSMNLVVYDINRNPIENFDGEVAISAPEGVAGCPESIRFTVKNRGVAILNDVSAIRPGVFRVEASLPEYDLTTKSNPVVCEESPGDRIFWGDLHAHGWGDCTMLLMHDRNWKCDPSARHRQARELGRFDYAAPGAMSMPSDETRESIWRAYLEAFDANDEPGEYVPFMSMEMHPGQPGDRTVVFRDRTESVPELNSMGVDVEELYEVYGDRDDVLLETHIGGAPPYFELYRPENEKLVEIASAFANAEWLLQKMLKEGYHPCVTGASDLHVGFLGAPRAVETFRGRFGKKLNVRDSGFGSGPVGALLAPRLTREELWKSLSRRRGYATSGDRIYLRLDAGGHEMGEIADLPESFDLNLRIHGQTAIERVDLIVGESLAGSWLPSTEDFDLTFVFDRRAMPLGKWFYFRVRQSNWEYAWTAPVWFAGESEMGDASREWPPWNHTEPPTPCFSDELLAHQRDLESYLVTEGDRDIFGEIVPIRIADESMGVSAVFASTLLQANQETGLLSPESRGTAKTQIHKEENGAENSGTSRLCDWNNGFPCDPVTIRWFFEYEIPKIRVDYGYDNFGPVDCHRGATL